MVAGCAGDETDTSEDEGDTPSTDPTETDTESETDSEESNGTEIFEQWAFETGDEVYSSPVVVDGTVYVGSADGNVYALDAGDGSEQWVFATGDWVRLSPAVVDGTVYIGSYDSNVYALSVQ